MSRERRSRTASRWSAWRGDCRATSRGRARGLNFGRRLARAGAEDTRAASVQRRLGKASGLIVFLCPTCSGPKAVLVWRLSCTAQGMRNESSLQPVVVLGESVVARNTAIRARTDSNSRIGRRKRKGGRNHTTSKSNGSATRTTSRLADAIRRNIVQSLATTPPAVAAITSATLAHKKVLAASPPSQPQRSQPPRTQPTGDYPFAASAMRPHNDNKQLHLQHARGNTDVR